MSHISDKFSRLAYSCLITFLLLTSSSCNDFIEVDPPITDLTTDVVFENAKTIEAAMNGLYSYTFVSGIWDNAVEIYSGMLSDELYYRLSNYDFIRYNVYNPTSTTINNYWINGYKAIYHANSVIKGLEGSTILSTNLKNQYIAEAKFIRAYFHFLLTNFYGDVPLILSTSVTESSLAPRTEKADVIKQVIVDLTEAETALVASGNTRIKVTQSAATALLARVYLYSADWANAEAKANAVIASSGLKLETLDRVFLRSSSEAIFKISSNGSSTSYIGYAYMGSQFVPAGSATVNYRITDALLKSFETGDLRKSKWIGRILNGKDTLAYPYKYKLRARPTDESLAEESVLFRLAEQYLIRAEARAKLGKTSDAAADLNILRKRAGLADLPATLTSEELFVAVEKERQSELFLEGHRWFDLIRTGKADAVFGNLKPDTWKSYAALLPIPIKEIQTNPNLKQNPGYE